MQRDENTDDTVRSQRNAARFHAVNGADHQSLESNTRTSRARSQKSLSSNSNQSSSQKNNRRGNNRRNNSRGRKGRNRKNGGSNDPPNFSPFLNFPKFPREILERTS